MLNENIRLLRLAAGKSQVELAKALGVTKQSVSNWENDNILPSIEMLQKLAAYFKVSTDRLLGNDGKKYIEVSGLTDEQLYHIQRIVEYIKEGQK